MEPIDCCGGTRVACGRIAAGTDASTEKTQQGVFVFCSHGSVSRHLRARRNELCFYHEWTRIERKQATTRLHATLRPRQADDTDETDLLANSLLMGEFESIRFSAEGAVSLQPGASPQEFDCAKN